ncbi:hypothetical protein TNCV_1759781 [Trichonephila clavipes]|nr:hypothetical protein TNCV_1759781 [Trichonephila clavipes]
MLVWKQWTDEHQTTRNTGSGGGKVLSARDDQHPFRMAVNVRTAFSRQFAGRLSTAIGSPSRQSTNGRFCNDERRASKDNWSQFSSHLNHASTCGTMMAAFVLDAMSVNAVF